MASDEQIKANRENAKLSHGPVTSEGKKICSQNALKHALTGATVLLPEDDVDAYNNLVAIIFNKYKPVTDAEKLAIQLVADTEWRLLCIPIREAAVFARGRLENDDVFNQVPEEEREFLREGDTQHRYSNTLLNLTLQQSRLQRFLERKVAEFKQLRAEREVVELAERKMATDSITGDPNKPCHPHPSIGSVFSVEFLFARIAFVKTVGADNVAVFDRTWSNKMAKRAS